MAEEKTVQTVDSSVNKDVLKEKSLSEYYAYASADYDDGKIKKETQKLDGKDKYWICFNNRKDSSPHLSSLIKAPTEKEALRIFEEKVKNDKKFCGNTEPINTTKHTAILAVIYSVSEGQS